MIDTPILVVSTVARMRELVRDWRARSQSVALVPTMGALHDGHLALVRRAKAAADRVVTSIFVNPTQFAPHEDFTTYPRTFESDCAKLAALGCDAVWAPTAAEMYPDGFATTISLGGPAEGLETDFRPNFFKGVATVCCKLFTQVAPDVAVFGEKDYQQLCVIQRMVSDLDLPLSIIGHPTVREASGLAMSSRNAYLDDSERDVATALHRTMSELAARVRSGDAIGPSEREAAAQLLDAGFSSVDYITVRNARTLRPIDVGDHAARLQSRILAAAWLGKTRLIDNIPVCDDAA
ncbi:MAG: pantoate--beta-alanine ligase [Hyphomicrobiaceae bacterium]